MVYYLSHHTLYVDPQAKLIKITYGSDVVLE